ncbi:uncharacterized protein TRIADDRAFT_54769 [Trichoplax adhaerens]|uniref:YEATS domain-containing protein 2 n=1 Tax=Trichoplax adhaerens TaxID=10228 RepID=B3RSY2_TRIAD|nr:hypothetical protein TRIADDRAFT_54769 [Trichoplax adhaerens]EDV27127.1 hypothetical protein TRIADDRAFT_54769 [Trichoplax adhaerens]|eukprot:XP_002111123.1 hypothetical protein TRIADDRAFT_54769 [Trichoplax adhaerens]
MADPDYEDVNYHRKRMRLEDSGAKELAIQKIEDIITNQFDTELRYKEREIATIDQRIYQVRAMLDKIRACIIAKFYGTPKPLEQLTDRTATDPDTAENEDIISRNLSSQKLTFINPNHPAESIVKEARLQNSTATKTTQESKAIQERSSRNEGDISSRFYTKKRIIIGNTSKYIPLDQRDEHNQSTHKWMVYVRGTEEVEPEIHQFVKCVWFFLHPSYRPNDLVKVNQPPFHLTRRGWGEFPVRVQLHFVDSHNKRVDVIHHLKLDRTYTGLQTLGSETIVDVELYHEWKTDVDTVSNAPVSPDNLDEIVDELISKDSNPEIVGDNDMFEQVTSPDTFKYEPEIETKFDLEQLLEEGAKVYQLISENSTPLSQPYCAKNCETFFSWNIGKRRAAEWQRAIDMKKFIGSHSPGLVQLPTTKQITIWCRQHGYTPVDLNSKRDGGIANFCHICGRLLYTGNQQEFKENMKTNHVCKTSFDLLAYDNEAITEINVVDNSEAHESIDNKRTVIESENQEVSIPPLPPELQWIRDTSKEIIGVDFQTVKKGDVETPLSERIIFEACKGFIKHILRKSVAVAAKGSSSSVIDYVLVPSHIHAAIKEIENCDFITKSCLGQEIAAINELES